MNEELKTLYEKINPWLKIPEKISPACVAFIAESLREDRFRAFLLSLNLFVLTNPRLVIEHHKHNQGSSEVEEVIARNETEEAFRKRIYQSYFLDAHTRFVDELRYCKIVDNWLVYISDLLALIFTSRPEVLKSSEQVRLDYILQFKDTETMIAALAERKVEKLAYLGLKELADYFQKELGFSLFTDNKTMELAVVAVETRNVIVHARGKVSKILLSRLPNHTGKLGEAIHLGDPTELSRDLFVLTMDIDKRATDKWSLPFSLTSSSKEQ